MLVQRCVIFCLLSFLGFGQTGKLTGQLAQLNEEQQCDAICTGPGGRAEYLSQNKLCKCILSKRLDDEQVARLFNEAAELGIRLKVVGEESKGNGKREVQTSSPKNLNEQSSAPKPSLEPTTTTTKPKTTPVSKPIASVTSTSPKTVKLRSKSLFSTTEVSNSLTKDLEERKKELQKKIDDFRKKIKADTEKNTKLALAQRNAFHNEDADKIFEKLKIKTAEVQEKLKSKLPALKMPTVTELRANKLKENQLTKTQDDIVTPDPSLNKNKPF